jgi:multiple antibiotic resistance protein
MVGEAPAGVYRSLARKIAVSTALFLLAMDLAGAAVLKLFGISLPVVQLAGGLVLASMGWKLLNERDEEGQSGPSPQPANPIDLQKKVFCPFTFPVTAGHGVLVVMLTLCAHASKGGWVDAIFAHLGVLAGMILMCLVVFLAYPDAPRITARISPSTAHGEAPRISGPIGTGDFGGQGSPELDWRA